MKLKNVFSIEEINPNLLELDISGLSLDSRRVKKDNLFIALDGHVESGMNYINEAIDNGANSLLVSNVNIIEDKKSGEYKLSHHVDLKSGFYNGKKILDI